MTATLTGDKKLDRKLKRLGGKTANKVSAQGIRAGMRVIVKGIKSEIPPSAKSARKAIGMRFKKSKKFGVTAKVGGGVGKKKAAKGERGGVGKKKAAKGERGGKPGVGIGVANIHWLLMGTGERTQKTTGRRTGVMPAVGAVKRGFAKSETAAIQKTKDTIRQGIAREMAKK